LSFARQKQAFILDGKITHVNSDNSSSAPSATAPSKEGEGTSIFERAFGILTALIGVIVLIWSWRSFSNNLVRGFALASILAFAVALDCLYRELKKGKPAREYVTSLASLAALCICATIVLLNLLNPLEGLNQSQLSAAVSVQVPQAALTGNPLPTVTCREHVYGAGSIPRGYQLVIGYREQSSHLWAFWPQVMWRAHQWNSTVFIGGPSNTNTVYMLSFEVVPSGLARSLLDAFDQGAEQKDNFWNSTKPLPFALLDRQETVRRSDKPGC
jgi:hypothetical protein